MILIVRGGMLFCVSHFPGRFYHDIVLTLTTLDWSQQLILFLLVIVRYGLRCKMCRERVPGYKYFIFTDEDVTLKVQYIKFSQLIKG